MNCNINFEKVKKVTARISTKIISDEVKQIAKRRVLKTLTNYIFENKDILPVDVSEIGIDTFNGENVIEASCYLIEQEYLKELIKKAYYYDNFQQKRW